MAVDSKLMLRRALGVFLLLTTVGLATCQSVVNSFSDPESRRPAADVIYWN